MARRYIDRDALVAEIEERRDSLISLSESCPPNTAAKSGFYAQAQTLEGIKNFIGTLEVKEVDLDDKDEWKNTGGFGSTWDPDSPDYCPD